MIRLHDTCILDTLDLKHRRHFHRYSAQYYKLKCGCGWGEFLRAMAKIGYTRKHDCQNRVSPSTLVPGHHLIGQRPPRPDSGRIWNGSTRFWLLLPPSATRFQSHLPDYSRAIRPVAHTRTRHRVIEGRGGLFLRSAWSCVRQNFNFVVQSVCDAPIITTSYQKLPFGNSC